MRFRKILLAIVVACLSLSSTVKADDQLLIDRYLSMWSGPKGLETLRYMATCTAKNFPSAAQNFVRGGGDENYIMENNSTLKSNKCFKTYWFKSSVTVIDPYIYSQILAEALLTQSYKARDIPDLSAVKPLDHPSLPNVVVEDVHPQYRELFIIDKIKTSLEHVSECVSRAEPVRVFEMAQALSSSAEEIDRMKILAPAIAKCGGDKIKVNLPQFIWRGALVRNLFRLVDEARPIDYAKVVPNA